MFKSPRRYLHIQQFYRNCSSSDVNHEQASGRLNQLPPSNWTLNEVSRRDSLTEKRKAHNLEITRSTLVRGISFFSPLSFYSIKNTYLSPGRPSFLLHILSTPQLLLSTSIFSPLRRITLIPPSSRISTDSSTNFLIPKKILTSHTFFHPHALS